MTAARTPTRLHLERATALRAVVAASRLCMAVRAEFVPSLVTDKPDRSPVTVADLGAQALVSMALAEALPGDALMAEEDATPLRGSPSLDDAVLRHVRAHRPGVSAADVREALDRGGDAGGPGRRWWTLDPVDGTKGFLRDGQYAVALALVEDGEVSLAVMGAPNLPLEGPPDADGPRGCLFVAERGEGSWQLGLDEAERPVGGPVPEGRPISVAAITGASEAVYTESVESGHTSRGDATRIANRLGIVGEPIRLDSQAKYAVVARGDASIYLRLPHADYVENVWDHAAGWLIVTEAGGRVSDATGRPLDFARGRRLEGNRGVVATAAAIHGEVLGAVRAILG